MKYKIMLLMAVTLCIPLIVKPMEPKPIAKLRELAQRKEEREKEAPRFRLREREMEERMARLERIIQYWELVQNAIKKGGLQELTKTAEAEGLDISVKRKDPNGNTILHYAAEFNKPDVIEEYVVNGINPDPVNNAGLTPLMIAVRKGNIAVASELLNKGARINVGTKRSGTYPLFDAIDKNKWDIVQLLLEHGANLNFKGPAKHSILEYLELLNKTEDLNKLLEIVSSLKPTEQRTQWIDQIAHIIEQLEQQEEREFKEEWTVIEREPTVTIDPTLTPLEQQARKAAREAAEKDEPTFWERIFSST